MSIRDGLEPSRSPDSDPHTQPLPRGEAAPDHPAAASQLQPPGPSGPDAAATPGDAPSPATGAADQTWPPSWGQPPPSWGQAPAPTDRPGWPENQSATDRPAWPDPPASSDRPAWTEPPGAKGPSWTQPAGSAAATAPAQPAASATDPGPAQPSGSDTTWTGADQPRSGWGQDGGGGHPTVPTWGSRPADGGSPRSRRPSSWLAAVVAGVVLLASGFAISQALDRNDQTTAGAGIPTAAAPVAAAPAASGEEPVAAVAKALLPAVVEISRGSGLGSGFVYDKSGYIMTAAHVVQGASQVDVRLYDGTKLNGRVVGTDELNDVAVVKVDHAGLTVAPLAIGQTVQVGQLAVAIGSPFGLNETVTAGIVSSTDRILGDGREVLQTDAPINPGNSGGLLADRRGRVIGINDAIQATNGSNGNVGIGFAIPIDLAAKSAAAIVQGKQVQTGYLGVTMAPATGGQDGALVQEVASGGPADRAGLRPGDLVVAVDGRAVQNYSELGARIRAHKPGDKIAVKVIRGGNETTVTATLTQRPAG